MNREISWNIVNSLLAGGLVLMGSLADGDFTLRGLGIAIVAGLLIAITKFRDYWTTKEKVYKCGFFNFF